MDDDHIAAAKMVQQAHQFRTVAVRSQELLINTRAPGLAERGALQLEVLVIGRDPRITDQHHRRLSRISSQNGCLSRRSFAIAKTAAFVSLPMLSRNLLSRRHATALGSQQVEKLGLLIFQWVAIR
jgi:hypothetical protein